MKIYPIIKIAIFFIIGIIFEKLFHIGIDILLTILIILFLLSTACYFIFKERLITTISILILASFFITGASIFEFNRSLLKTYPFEKQKYSKSNVYGKITSIDLIKEDRIVFNAQLDSAVILLSNYKLKHEFVVKLYDKNYSSLKKLYNSLNIGQSFTLAGTIQKARDKRNPGEFDYNDYLLNKNISGVIACYDISKLELSSNETKDISDKFINAFHHLRASLDDEIEKLYNPKIAALLRGLLLGDDKKIDEESLDNFANAGVIHVFAVSGQHVALILAIFVLLFNRTNIFLKYIFTIIGLILFVFITGNQVSVHRAAIMGIIYIIVILSNRDRNLYNALLLSAFVILIASPNELFNPGFQLSYAASISIIYFYPKFRSMIAPFEIKSKIIRWLILLTFVSLSAQIGIMPFLLAYFHKLSVSALIANIVIVPLSALIIYAGIFTLFIGLISTWLASVFALATGGLGFITTKIVNYFGSSDFSYLQIYKFSLYDALIYYAALFLIVFIFIKYKNMLLKFAASFMVIISMFLFMALDNYSISAPNDLSVIGVDVGQGDATLLKFPNGQTGLIDAGNSYEGFSNGDKVILPLMNNLDIKFIDYTFITHIDADHYAGLFKLVEKGKIRTVYKPSPDSLNKADIQFERFLRKYNCRIKYYNKEIVSVGNCRLYFYNHPNLLEGVKYSTNSKSMLLRLLYGSNSFLFTGDAEKGIEANLIKYAGYNVRSNVLKIGHHGSKSSSYDGFVKIVSPQYALISCGIENRFNHPAPETMEKLIKSKVSIHRTDKEGAIIFNSDGNKISIFDWKKKESHYIFDL